MRAFLFVFLFHFACSLSLNFFSFFSIRSLSIRCFSLAFFWACLLLSRWMIRLNVSRTKIYRKHRFQKSFLSLVSRLKLVLCFSPLSFFLRIEFRVLLWFSVLSFAAVRFSSIFLARFRLNGKVHWTFSTCFQFCRWKSRNSRENC